MPPQTTFSNLPDGLNFFSLFDQMFQYTGLLGIIPCSATGTNNLVLTPISQSTPNITVYSDYLAFSFVAPTTSTTTVTLSISGLPALVLYSQSGQVATSILTGTIYIVLYDHRLNSGTGGFHVVGNPTSTRIQLTAGLQLYVSMTGSDTTGNGSIAFPFATLQHTYGSIIANIDLAGNSVQVDIGAGTFAGLSATSGSVLGGPLINFVGAGSSSTFIQCLPDGAAFFAKDLAIISISGMTIEDNAGGTGAQGILVGQEGIVDLGADIVFGTIANGVHLQANDGGATGFGANYTIAGNALVHLLAVKTGRINTGAFVASIPTALAFNTFAAAQYAGIINAAGYSVTGSGVSGTTGLKFSFVCGGDINSAGADLNTTFPGNSSGVYSFGPQGGFWDFNNTGTWISGKLTTPIITTSAFSGLPTPAFGMMAVITDSTTNTWGATVSTGGGGDIVLVWYNNSNWTVIGK